MKLVRDDKLGKLLLQALTSLDDALKAKMEGDTETLSKKIWEIGANLEYLLFIMDPSIENSGEKWKENKKSTRTVNICYELSAVQALLKDSFSVRPINLEEGYRKVWVAQERILRVQKELERAKKTT